MQTNRLFLIALASVCASVGFLMQASAQEAAPRSRPGPPPEAFSACEGKSEGATCKVEFHQHALEGKCVSPHSEELFCMPNQLPEPPPGGEHGRPPR